MSSYYTEEQYIPLVDKNGNVTGSAERWKVHKNGILHKGFTVALYYKKHIILQKRKHPVFDNVIDATCSSHPLMIQDKPQDEKEAVINCISREWGIHIKNKKNIVNRGSIVYRAKDSDGYIEHEYCTMYAIKLDSIPLHNKEYAYGYEVVDIQYYLNNSSFFNLAPWVKKGIHLTLSA